MSVRIAILTNGNKHLNRLNFILSTDSDYCLGFALRSFLSLTSLRCRQLRTRFPDSFHSVPSHKTIHRIVLFGRVQIRCLGFSPRSDSFAFCALHKPAQYLRYPDFVRPKIRLNLCKKQVHSY